MLISAALLFLLFALSSILGINLALLIPFVFKNKKVMKLDASIKAFFRKETSSGYVLVFCAVLSFIVANTTWGRPLTEIWNRPLQGHPFSDWINDGLMSFFFLLIGLELKHELRYGTLRSRCEALIPVAAAIGGILVPILIYLGFQAGTPSWKGFGIPMATDIALALAALAIFGNKVPPSLKIFLLSIAIIHDTAAVLVITLFHTSDFILEYFLAALLNFGTFYMFGRFTRTTSRKGEKWLTVFLLIGGFQLWWIVSASGIHASICGALVALCIPSRGEKETSPARRLQKRLHQPVYYIILPLFVLSNMAIPLQEILPADGFSLQLFTQNHSLGILLGLLLGKPLGILIGSCTILATGKFRSCVCH